MSNKQSKKAAYKQEEDRIVAHSEAFIELLVRRGILGDQKIDNEKIRIAQQEKKKNTYHNTLMLLKHYRTIAWMLECFPDSIAEELDQPFGGLDELIDRIDIESSLDNKKLESRIAGIQKSRILLDRVNEALIRTYADFGITHDNDSLYLDPEADPPVMKKMPILGDLHKNLLQNKMTERIAVIVSRFVTGSAQSFNQQTNVDLTNKYIVLDLSELKGKLLPVGMMIALDYVWDNIKADRTKKKAILIDEIWQLIGASSNKQAADFCLTIFKTIRGFGGAAISATQDLSDFFSLEDGKYGRAIVNNSKNKIILNLEPDEARYVQDVLKLTKTEMRSITRFERGEALVYSNNNKVPVVIKASKEEQEMITTDRAELEALLREKKKAHKN